MSELHQHPDEHGPDAPYLIQLLFREKPALDRELWAERVRRQLGESTRIELLPDPTRHLVALPDLKQKHEGVPVRVSLVEGPLALRDQLDEALSQTWDWAEAESRVQSSGYSVVVSDEFAGALARETRLQLVHALVNAVMEQAMPEAIHWISSRRIVEPAFYRQSLHHGGGLADAVVNVRLYRIGDGVPGETVMDTLGLEPFGLPDLQIHFSGLDPGALAPVLLGYAEYLFEKGAVLGDEAIVRGVESWDEWSCVNERALAPPARAVVNIVPDNHAVKH